MRHRQIYCLSLVFLVLSSLYLPVCSLTLQDKQTPLDSISLSKNPLKLLQSFGFTELVQKSLKESPTQTVANLFAYYIDGRVLQNFAAAIFDRSQQNNLLSYQGLATVLNENGLTDLNADRILNLLDLEEGSQVDFARFYTMSNVLFNEALTLVTYVYIMDKEKTNDYATALDLATVEKYILKIFHKLENIYPQPRCEEIEYLFQQSDKDGDNRLSVQEFHYLLSIFLRYYRSGIRSNEYASIIFQDKIFDGLWNKVEQEEEDDTQYIEHVQFIQSSFYTFLQISLHEGLLNQVGHIVFSKLDTSGDGKISPEEFSDVLGRLGGSQDEIQLIITAADTNRDGDVDFSEFLVALETLSKRIAATFGSDYFVLTQKPATFENVWELLEGYIPDDVKLLSRVEVEGIYHAFDINRSGDHDEHEFRSFISELITYWKEKVDARDDQDMDEIVILDPTPENIEQVQEDKQAEDDQTEETDQDASEIIDVITEQQAHTESSATGEITESSEPITGGTSEAHEETEIDASEIIDGEQDTEDSHSAPSESGQDVTEIIRSELASESDEEVTESHAATDVTVASEPSAVSDVTEETDEDVTEIIGSEPASESDEEVTESSGATDATVASEPSAVSDVTEESGASESEPVASEDIAVTEETESSAPVVSESVEDVTEIIRSELASESDEEVTESSRASDVTVASEPSAVSDVTEESGASESEPVATEDSGTAEETESSAPVVSESVEDEQTEEAGSETASSGEVTESSVVSQVHEETEDSEPVVSESVEDVTEIVRSELASESDEEVTESSGASDVTVASEPSAVSDVTEESGASESEPVATEDIGTAEETESSAPIASDVTEETEETQSEPVDVSAGSETAPSTEITKTASASTQEEETESEPTESEPAATEEKTESEAVKEIVITNPTQKEEPTPSAPESTTTTTPATTTTPDSTKTQETTSTTTPAATTTPDSTKTQETTSTTTPAATATSESTKTQETTPATTPAATTTPASTKTQETTSTTTTPTTPAKPKVLKFQQADFNGDGLTDFLRRPLSNSDKANSVIFLSKGDGTFKTVKFVEPYYIPADMTDVYIGDFNGDGKTDLFRREKGSWAVDKVYTAVIYFSNGDGTFKSVVLPESYNLDGQSSELSFGDFDGDGKTDFINQKKGSWTVVTATVYLSNGDGTFRTTTVGEKSYELPADLTNIIVGDFNGDGKSDFIRQEKGHWALDDTNSVSLFTSLGNGNFKTTTLPSKFDLKGNDQKLFVGDFNGDGYDDILAQVRSYISLAFSANTPGLYISDGKGGFTFQSMKGSIPAVESADIYLGNFDGDSKADFIVQYGSTSANPQAVLFLSATTSPSIGFATYNSNDFAIPGDLTNLKVGDFNGDGKDDFIRQETGNWASDDVNTADTYLSSCTTQSSVPKSTGNAKNLFSKVSFPSNSGLGGLSANLVITNEQGN